MTPSIENGIALANYYHVSLDYIVGLSSERSPNAGGLAASFATLAGLVGDAAPTASDVAALVDASIMYAVSGKPCGEQPLTAWRNFMHGRAVHWPAKGQKMIARACFRCAYTFSACALT